MLIMSRAPNLRYLVSSASCLIRTSLEHGLFLYCEPGVMRRIPQRFL